MPEPRSLPPALRSLADAPRPVRPLMSPGVRALLVVAISVAAVVGFAMAAGLRPGWRSIAPLVLWLPVAVRLVAGSLLVWWALAEGEPGSGPPSSVRSWSLLLAPVVVLVSAELVGRALPSPPSPLGAGSICMTHELLLGLPLLALVAWLLVRAFPLRPLFAAIAAGGGVGLFADAALHLVCPRSDLGHAIFAHGGAVLLLMAVGGIGSLVGRGRRA